MGHSFDGSHGSWVTARDPFAALPPGLIFGMWEYFCPGSDKFEFWKFFHIFDGVMT